MNFVTVLALIVSSTLVYSAPLIFTALGGTFSENSGIVNVGLEGIMTMGAFTSIVFNLSFASTFGTATPWLGALLGGIVGIIFSLLHAVATVNWRADHVISGTVLNLMAPPLAVFLIKAIYNKGQTENINQNFGYFSFPGLANIPVIGPIFFKNTSAPAWVAIVLSIFLYWVLYKTRFGLRLRSSGENPQAADTLGINVYKMRYAGVLISGFLGGIGGAVFAEAIAGNSLFFGFAQSLSIIGDQLPGISSLPSVYLQIAPYVLTIIVLVVFFGKTVGPAADGQNYIKSK